MCKKLLNLLFTLLFVTAIGSVSSFAANGMAWREELWTALLFAKMQEMQTRLQDKYQDQWEPISPETGKNKLLWMIGEIGEVIDIVKKYGDIKAVSDTELREKLIEEMADVLMYYNDVMLCYKISEEELRRSYTKKFEKNMTRW